MSKRWRPTISTEQWYARWALNNYRTDDDSNSRESYLFGLLEANIMAADAAFEKAYQAYCSLTRARAASIRSKEDAT
jgi:hypothetical protein